MKPFNLEEALKGKPCVTRNGDKAMVVFDKSVLSSEAVFPLVGYLFKNNKWVAYESTWKKDGACASSGKEDVDDIVGMWEESQPEVTVSFPAPLKEAEEGQAIWTLAFTGEVCGYIYDDEYSKQRLDNGLLFRTEADAKAWLDVMKGARR